MSHFWYKLNKTSSRSMTETTMVYLSNCFIAHCVNLFIYWNVSIAILIEDIVTALNASIIGHLLCFYLKGVSKWSRILFLNYFHSLSPACQHQRTLLEHRAREAGIPAGRVYLPQCDENGEFAPQQCHPATTTCWCVDNKGVERPGTRVSQPATPDCQVSPGGKDETFCVAGCGSSCVVISV